VRGGRVPLFRVQLSAFVQMRGVKKARAFLPKARAILRSPMRGAEVLGIMGKELLS
jgi:hypothetical protein